MSCSVFRRPSVPFPGLVKTLLLGLLLTTIAGLAGRAYLRSSLQAPSGAVELPGAFSLSAPVQVQVDPWGIPYVKAKTLSDALFAQGFLHAGHRLWQMMLLRRAAQGRLAAIFGQSALPVDRMSRTLDLQGAAKRALRGLDAKYRQQLEAYATGVNARLATWEGAWPPEFVLLGIEPDRWAPWASLAIAKLMALDLTTWQKELSRWHASRVLPGRKFRFLQAGYPDWAPTILKEQGATAPKLALTPPFEGIKRDITQVTGIGPVTGEARLWGCPKGGDLRSGSPVTGPEPHGKTFLPLSKARSGTRRASDWDPSRWNPLTFLESLSAWKASNAWVLAGQRTVKGHPILTNDMHLALRAPAHWYLASLSAEKAFTAAGLTFPGVPGIVVGLNRNVAWGFSNGMVDDIDFAVEEIGPQGDRYKKQGTLVSFNVRRETIPVRGREQPVVHRVRSTHRGPIITDVLKGLEGPLSVQWVPAKTASAFEGLLRMNRATTVAEFDLALQDFTMPHQNVVFADREGNVGYRLGGRIPLRGNWSGGLPLPASRMGAGWKGFWPPGAHPAGRNPTKGFYATTNNLQAPGLYGLVGQDYPLPFRARRLVDRLKARSDWTLRATNRLARDTRSLFADRVAERAVAAARRIGAETVADRLAAWDHRVGLDSHAAPLFYAWLYALRDRVAADEYGGGGRWAHFPDDALLRLLEGKGGEDWVDDVRTPQEERLLGLEEKAMRNAVQVVDGRRWGELQHELHRHPLGRKQWLDLVFGFNVGPNPSPGARHTLRASGYKRWAPIGQAVWRPPWQSRHGPSQRFVVALRPNGPPEAHFLLPTGQSGNPFSVHYRDMHSRWQKGRPIPLPLSGPAPGELTRSYTLRAQ